MSGWNNPVPIGDSSGELYGGHGRRLIRMLQIIAYYAQTRVPPAHIEPLTPGSSEPRCSLPLAFSSPSSLQLALFCFPRPHLYAFFFPLPLSIFTFPPIQELCFPLDTCFSLSLQLTFSRLPSLATQSPRMTPHTAVTTGNNDLLFTSLLYLRLFLCATV